MIAKTTLKKFSELKKNFQNLAEIPQARNKISKQWNNSTAGKKFHGWKKNFQSQEKFPTPSKISNSKHLLTVGINASS